MKVIIELLISEPQENHINVQSGSSLLRRSINSLIGTNSAKNTRQTKCFQLNPVDSCEKENVSNTMIQHISYPKRNYQSQLAKFCYLRLRRGRLTLFALLHFVFTHIRYLPPFAFFTRYRLRPAMM